MATANPTQRARELAEIARALDTKKKELAYGEFERWAVRTYPKYPIQVLRYLRKANRVFGRDLPRLLAQHGQKKVFLLVGLADPWEPLRDGVAAAGGARTPLSELSVSQLRARLRERGGVGGAAWGGVSLAIDRVSALWPRLKRVPLALALVKVPHARRQLERFRDVLRGMLGQVDEALATAARATGAPARARRAKAPARRPPAPFLD
jgi:hypothetical protein